MALRSPVYLFRNALLFAPTAVGKRGPNERPFGPYPSPPPVYLHPLPTAPADAAVIEFVSTIPP